MLLTVVTGLLTVKLACLMREPVTCTPVRAWTGVAPAGAWSACWAHTPLALAPSPARKAIRTAARKRPLSLSLISNLPKVDHVPHVTDHHGLRHVRPPL